MADDDVRIARWDMRATAGTTVSRPFSATTAVTAVTVYTGGTVDDVDDLTGATAHEASVDPGGLSGTITVDVPTGNSVPLRLVVDGAVVTIGRLTPSTTGAATRDDTVTIAVAESSTLTLDLPSIVADADLTALEARVAALEATALTIGDA